MGEKKCKSCIYLVGTANSKKIDICINKEKAEGKLYLANSSNKACRNFQASRFINRPKVEQPKKGDIKFIALTKGKIAIVDAEDYELLKQYKWHSICSDGSFYAYRCRNKKSISMHRMLMNAPKGKVVDHIDGNGLNNRRSNLRICTVSENIRNSRGRHKTSKYKGVHWNKRAGKWVSSITEKGKYEFLGHFDDEAEAAKIYDKRAKRLFGEYAYLNFPDEINKLQKEAFVNPFCKV